LLRLRRSSQQARCQQICCNPHLAPPLPKSPPNRKLGDKTRDPPRRLVIFYLILTPVASQNPSPTHRRRPYLARSSGPGCPRKERFLLICSSLRHPRNTLHEIPFTRQLFSRTPLFCLHAPQKRPVSSRQKPTFS
jgi:hypothetical protein